MLAHWPGQFLAKLRKDIDACDNPFLLIHAAKIVLFPETSKLFATFLQQTAHFCTNQAVESGPGSPSAVLSCPSCSVLPATGEARERVGRRGLRVCALCARCARVAQACTWVHPEIFSSYFYLG